MKITQGDGPRLLVLAGLGGAAIAVHLGGAATAGWLRYQRAAVLDGDWWRLLTAHLVHLNGGHLFMNLLAWLVIWFYAGRKLNGAQWLASLLCCSLTTGFGLLLVSPGIDWYVGLSGVLHGLLATAALVRWRHGDRSGVWVLAGLVVKLSWEQLLGPLPGSVAAVGGAVVVDAHLYGALGGVLAGALIVCRRVPRTVSR